jgi:hypothetical protein
MHPFLAVFVGISLLLLFHDASLYAAASSLQNILIINALDANALAPAIQFAEDVPKNESSGLAIKIWSYDTSAARDVRTKSLQKYETHFYKTVPLNHTNIGNKNIPPERVTALLEALEQTVDEAGKINGETNVVSIAIGEGIIDVTGHSIMNIFNRLWSPNENIKDDGVVEAKDILLLEKTSQMTSVSDWHDFMVFGMKASKPIVKSWLSTFRDVFYYYADRPAFQLMDPRPALLEASTRLRTDLKIGYLTYHDICVPTETHQHHHDKSNSCASSAALTIQCSKGPHMHLCDTHQPHAWKHHFDNHIPGDYAGHSRVKKQQWDTHLPHGMSHRRLCIYLAIAMCTNLTSTHELVLEE